MASQNNPLLGEEGFRIVRIFGIVSIVRIFKQLQMFVQLRSAKARLRHLKESAASISQSAAALKVLVSH